MVDGNSKETYTERSFCVKSFQLFQNATCPIRGISKLFLGVQKIHCDTDVILTQKLF